jgi:hypothetical protein
MRHNFLITCGTSQLAEEKFQDYPYSKDELGKFLRQAEKSGDPKEFFNKSRGLYIKIVEYLVSKKDELEGPSVTDKPFGGEISTLAELDKLDGWENWSKKEDNYHILSSDTRSGYFCAQVLRRLLIDPRFYGIPENNVPEPLIVSCLKEKSNTEAEANEGMKEFALRVGECLVHTSLGKKQDIRNVAIVTGGFKSVIPCLTLYSLYFGIEMIYLYERSHFPQTLFPNISFQNDDQREQWIQSARTLLTMNPKPGYLSYLLNKRVNAPDQVF